MNILVACEESQAVTKELRRLGHEAYSCDIIPCSGGHPEWHIMQDVTPLLSGFCGFRTEDGLEHYLDAKWDMIIAFPPCTHLSSSGQWAFSKGCKPIELREQGAAFFMMFANADCEKIAIENPIGIMSTRFRKPDQIIEPWMFGHEASKKTCLWLKNLPTLIPETTEKPEFEYHEWIDKRTGKKKRMEKWMYEIRVLPHKYRSGLASKTFQGIAKAMAEQWAGNANEEEKENKTMELKIYNPTEDGFIKAIDWNHEEIKKEVSAKVSYYKDLVYTDEQIKDAKADRATLNKFVTALEDKRKEIKKQCLAPYESFERQMKEIVAIVQEPIALIDAQVKGYEEKQKQEKIAQVKEHFESVSQYEWLRFEQIFNPRWENATCVMRAIHDEISGRLNNIKHDLDTLSNLPEFSFEATEVYKSTLDLRNALGEAHRLSEIAKKKAEHEAEQARLAAEAEFAKNMNPPVEVETHVVECGVTGSIKAEVVKEAPAKQWISFSALLSTEDALALKEFFNSRSIEFKAI